MSHFTVGVFVPSSIREIEKYIAKQMAPYDENMDYPEYERACWCVGRKARQHGDTMANKLVGTWDERRELFQVRPEVMALEAGNDAYDPFDDERRQPLWKAFNADFERAHEETQSDYATYHPLAGRAEPDCEECQGSGIEVSTYNPKSKWDWYRIGGR